MKALRFAVLICGLIMLALQAGAQTGASRAGNDSGGMSREAAYRQARLLTELGRKLFTDKNLSASGKLACSSCHSPAHAYGPPNALDVQTGGVDMKQPGVRAVPSLKYLQDVPEFTEHYFESEDEGDESVDNGPTGGLTWDGRADRGRDQARFPLLSPYEMANRDPAEISARLIRAGYGNDLARIYGPQVLRNGDTVFAEILEALEAFEQEAKLFYPYSSKYDAFLAGKAKLSPAEARGLALFEDPAKGNCAQCHISKRGNDGTPPQFTDYGMIALGVPRNRDIPANADPDYFDLGLCGPLRTDLASHPEYCGLFKTPSLRNVAARKTFFHNGVFHSLRQAIEFYVERDTNPGKWYGRNPDGSVDKYDDLPAIDRGNVNTGPPFGGKPGDRPALDDAEIGDLIAFLQTLTDGFKPGK
jgi:cytochrome c peroxidase